MPDSDDKKEHSWQHTDRGPYIKTYSGRKVFIADPRPEDFNLGDIARHLAGINRYTGASRYTVAQHCVVAARMARLFYPQYPHLAAKMLIHDADEAYYGDVNSPLKSLLPDYKRLEHNAQLAMEKFFDLNFVEDPMVKEVDYRMWLTEREILFAGRHGAQSEDYRGALEPFTVTDKTIGLFSEWPAEEAEAAWLEAHWSLFPWQR